MKCPRCSKKNLNKANYCLKCGYKFKAKDKENIKENFFVTIMNKISDFKDFITGDWLKNNNYVRVFSILFVLAIGLYMVLTMGYKLRLLNNEAYDVKYNEQLDTYYILIDGDQTEETKEVDAAFYVPNRISKLDLTYFDENDEVISEETHEKEDRYQLTVNTTENNYYILSNHDDPKERLKIYVYYGG